MMMGNQNPNVFTATQWEELEQQALIYKYMVSGVPVPSDLILSVRRSLYNNSSSSSSDQTTLVGGGWEGGRFPYINQLYQQQIGIGIGIGCRKIDLEPGRCRRTDGKKWRCSKEAYPDSKYCERHMHRGRNRSRKPVEFPPSSSKSDPYPSSINTTTTFMDSNSYSHQTFRNLQGMKDLDDQRSANYFQSNENPYNTTQKTTHHFNFQNLKHQQKKEEGTQHCYVMGTDFIKPSEEATGSKQQQPFHHFFSPPNNPNRDHQKQQLLIDPPKALSTQDLFQSKPSRPYW